MYYLADGDYAERTQETVYILQAEVESVFNEDVCDVSRDHLLLSKDAPPNPTQASPKHSAADQSLP